MTLTQQIISLCQSFKDLRQTFVVSRRSEKLCLRTQQYILSTVEDSVLRTEMDDLESQEEDVPKWLLWDKPMGFLGMIRLHQTRDETWSASL